MLRSAAAHEPPLRYRPTLRTCRSRTAFDFAALLDPPADAPQDFWSAAALRTLDARDAMPQIAPLTAVTGPATTNGSCSATCSAATRRARDFMVEVHDDGRARLRFGDDTHGRRPRGRTRFEATYRKGNGAAGNVGAEADRAPVLMTPALAIESFPIRCPRSAASKRRTSRRRVAMRRRPFARRSAPSPPPTTRRPAERRADVQRAAASFRWTGSWHTVFVTADRVGGAAVDSRFEDARCAATSSASAWRATTSRSTRRASCRSTSQLHVCVKPGYFRSEVLAAVRDVLSSALLPDGRLGVFHPDNFTLRRTGVSPAASWPLRRPSRAWNPCGWTDSSGSPTRIRQLWNNGVIPIGRLEIAQLDNDPNLPRPRPAAPERGRWPVSKPRPDPPRLASDPARHGSLRLLRRRR